MQKLLLIGLIGSLVIRLPEPAEARNAAKAATLGSSAGPDHITLTWTGDTADSQTITFRTSGIVTSGAVMFREKGLSPSLTNRQEATPDSLVSSWGDIGQGTCLLWSASLKGLKPSTTYQYSIATDFPMTDEFSFTTGPVHTGSVNFSFLVFGDSQDGTSSKPDYSVWHHTIRKAFSRNPGARFFVNMGDLVDIGGDYSHWNKWFAAAQCAMDHIPIMPVLGNHEIYGESKSAGYAKPDNFIRHFHLPNNGPEGLKGQCYSYDYGTVHIAVIDSQETEEILFNGPILQKQANWLSTDLAASSGHFKIVMFHKPPRSSKPHKEKECSALLNILCPVIERNHVDVVFNGHDHILARTPPLGNPQDEPEKRTGTIYYTTGRSGAKIYKGDMEPPSAAFFLNPKDQPCYLVVTIHDKTMSITAYSTDGTLLDTCLVDKT